MTINIPIPPPAFNAGGGCGDPTCDFQVGCLDCMIAARRQNEAWFARHGHRSTLDVFRTIVPAMIAADHEDALGQGL